MNIAVVSSTKHCGPCGKDLPVDSFAPVMRRGKPKLDPWCRDCRRNWNREYRNNNEEYRERRKKAAKERRVRLGRGNLHRRDRYGITPDEFQAMLASQNGLCAICLGKNQDEGEMLCVDHNHSTEAIRALLCRRCNFGIGYFRDDPEMLVAAIQYLETHK
jgi:hypothetical protein